MRSILAVAFTSLILAGCSGASSRDRAITVYYQDVDGTVKTRQINTYNKPDTSARLLCDMDCINWLESVHQ